MRAGRDTWVGYPREHLGWQGDLAGLALGPFRLEHPIGQGREGAVWRARRAPESPVESPSAEVAIKLVPPTRGVPAEDLLSVQGEVRALAQLDHPNIIRVLDFGIVDASGVASDGRRLAPGTFWVAMERGDRPLGSVRNWPEMFALLVQMLGALGHAHARGIVHRDVKPANILRVTSEGRPLWKLADFGIAQVRAAGAGRSARMGTPAISAPEQVLCEASWQGAWTDLYALACVTWRLLTGSKPFAGSTIDEMLQMHLLAPPPALRPRFPVPVGLEGWLHRSLAKHPYQRFTCAAEALEELRRIDRGPVVLVRKNSEDTDTWDTTAGGERHGSLGGEGTIAGDRASRKCRIFDRVPADAPPVLIPPQPELPQEPVTPVALLDASTALFRLRSIPLVGRLAERRVLWGELLEAHRSGRPRVVLLRGPRGIGKTRLANWLMVAAQEHGLAEVFAPAAGYDSVRRLVEARVDASELPDSELALRLAARMEQGVSGLGLVEGLEAGAPGDVDQLARQLSAIARARRTRSEDELLSVSAGLVNLARGRVATVWLDEVANGFEVLQWCRASIAEVSAPMLFVVALDDDETLDPLVEQLTQEGATTVELAPLAEAEIADLVRSQVRLAPGLAEQVMQYAAGNPGAAIQLVDGWLRAGLLRVTEHGLAPTDPERTTLPATAFLGSRHDESGWADRVACATHGLSFVERRELARAALLGPRVELAEWVRSARWCDAAALSLLSERLVDAGLADRATAGIIFAHREVTERLLALVDDSTRSELGDECAEALAGAIRPSRLGRLYLAARNDAKAIPELLLAAERMVESERLVEALATLDLCEAARLRLRASDGCDAASGQPGEDGSGDEDPLRGTILRLRLEALVRDGRGEAAAELAPLAVDDARRHDWVDLPGLLGAYAQVEIDRGRLPEARALLDEGLLRCDALQHLEQAQLKLRRARVQLETGELCEAEATCAEVLELLPAGHLLALRAHELLGRSHLSRGRPEHARDHLEHCLAAAPASIGTGRRVGICRALGHALARMGDEAGARELFLGNLNLGRRYGRATTIADALADLADCDRRSGRLDVAARGYLESVNTLQRIGREASSRVMACLGLTLVESGELERGRHYLEAALGRVVESERQEWHRVILGVLLPALVRERAGEAAAAAPAPDAELVREAARVLDEGGL